jgi:hypothetical protein
MDLLIFLRMRCILGQSRRLPSALRESVTSWLCDLPVASDLQLKLPFQSKVSTAIGWPMLNAWK